MKYYICPCCKKRKTTVLSWEKIPVAHEVDLITGKTKEIKTDTTDSLDLTCPDCGETLPQKMEKKIRKILGW